MSASRRTPLRIPVMTHARPPLRGETSLTVYGEESVMSIEGRAEALAPPGGSREWPGCALQGDLPGHDRRLSARGRARTEVQRVSLLPNQTEARRFGMPCRIDVELILHSAGNQISLCATHAEYGVRRRRLETSREIHHGEPMFGPRRNRLGDSSAAAWPAHCSATSLTVRGATTGEAHGWTAGVSSTPGGPHARHSPPHRTHGGRPR